MRRVRIIALDLDGTLLDSDKRLTDASRAALQRAADAGIEIVPATGRFFAGMPEEIRALPFLHYAITVNGAQVYDIRLDRAVYRAEIPQRLALEIIEYLDDYPLIYDCYMDNWGWMSESLWEIAGDFAPNEHYRKLLRDYRRPVPELKAHLREHGGDVQKISLYVKDMALHTKLMEELPHRFPETEVTSSIWNNIEINDKSANKGEALLQLAAYLGCGAAETVAFGDGLNDRSMIVKAGIGVAMANSHPELLAAADDITGDCDHDGVAAGIGRLCFSDSGAETNEIKRGNE